MPSKKYRGKACVYCGEPDAATVDHVLSRRTFHTSGQDDPPKAPSCAKCNKAKADLETYAGATLLFGSNHPEAAAHLGSIGERRLAKNERLRRELAEGMARQWRKDARSGLITPALTMAIDGERIATLGKMIARGLIWHFWKTRLEEGSTAIALWLSPRGEALFDRLLALKTSSRVDYALDSGMFSCVGAQSDTHPAVSVWTMRLFGGVDLTDSFRTRDGKTSTIGALTGPHHLLRPETIAGAF